MDVTRHWLAVRRDGSWDVIDSPAVAERRTRERGQVAGPFVPESQLQGAVEERDQALRYLRELRLRTGNARAVERTMADVREFLDRLGGQ